MEDSADLLHHVSPNRPQASQRGEICREFRKALPLRDPLWVEADIDASLKETPNRIEKEAEEEEKEVVESDTKAEATEDVADSEETLEPAEEDA